MHWRRLEDVLRTFLQNVLKTSWKDLEDVLKTSWTRLEVVWSRRIYWSWPRRLQDVLKTSSEDVWLRRIYLSWSRRLEDVFWSKRRKTFSRRLHQDECLLGIYSPAQVNQFENKDTLFESVINNVLLQGNSVKIKLNLKVK